MDIQQRKFTKNNEIYFTNNEIRGIIYLVRTERSSDKSKEATPMSDHNMEPKIKELMELKRMREELEAEITTIEDEIKNRMGTEETLLAGSYKVSWTTYTSSRFDSTRFKKDHAELAAAYTKQTTSRRFSIN